MPRAQPNRKKLNPKDRVTKDGRVLLQMYERLWPDPADRLYFYRKAMGYDTQRQLAEDCEVSSSVISRLECGYGLPKATTLMKIGKGIGLSSDYVLGLSNRKEIER